MQKNELFVRHDLNSNKAATGCLTVMDKIDELVPWQIKRSYWLTDATGQRGAHCVKGEKKFYIMAQGSCQMRIFDGVNWYQEILKGPSEAIEFKADLWREVSDFSKNAVMFTLCNDHYDRSKYITDLEEFIKYIKTAK